LIPTALEFKSWLTFVTTPKFSLLGAILEKQPGKTKAIVESELAQRQKEAYQKLLEDVENSNPAIAAELDNREPGDMP